MKLKDIKIFLMTGVFACGMAAAFISCTDKLDEVPDNRTEIDEPDKVLRLLT